MIIYIRRMNMKRLTTPELSFGVPEFVVKEMDDTANTKARVTFK
jgi:hypothetical protein